MEKIIHGANIGYVKKQKPVEQGQQPVVESPVVVVENPPKIEPVVEKPKSGDNEGGTGEGEFIDHSVESGWKAKHNRKAIQDKPVG